MYSYSFLAWSPVPFCFLPLFLLFSLTHTHTHSQRHGPFSRSVLKCDACVCVCSTISHIRFFFLSIAGQRKVNAVAAVSSTSSRSSSSSNKKNNNFSRFSPVTPRYSTSLKHYATLVLSANLIVAFTSFKTIYRTNSNRLRLIKIKNNTK